MFQGPAHIASVLPEPESARGVSGERAPELQMGVRLSGQGELPPLASRLLVPALELLWPTRCVVCDELGELICEACRAKLPWIDQRFACPNCGAPYGAITCTECAAPQGEPWECRSTVSALPLEGVGRSLAILYKDKGERRLAPVIAAIMATALDEASLSPALDAQPRFDTAAIDALCFVPATQRAYTRRGFDHMEAVARSLARMQALPFADILARPYGKDQRGLSKEERRLNTEASVQVVGDISGCNMLLVDDVITTGSSVRACTRALLAAGAASVSVCSLARAW